MQNLLSNKMLRIGLMAAVMLVGSFAIPHSANAQATGDQIATQCQNNPSCLSFDPAVNPLLKGLTVNKANSPGGTPKDSGTNGQCVVYNQPGFGGGIVSGCLKNGVFTIGESSSVAGGATGDSTTGAATTDSNGASTYQATTGTVPTMPGCDLAHIGDCILNTVAMFALSFANFMLGLAGVLLNWVIVKTVFQFASLIGNSAGLLTAWGILRDIGNLLLLFGFVLMGIGTILNTGKLPDKKAIPKLIIFAVLLNFSLFASEAVIDVSNVLTSVMYSQANTSPCLNTSDPNCGLNYGIAGHIMESTGLSGIYAVQSTDLSNFANKAWVIIGLAIFAAIGTVVLLAAAIMLAWRAITLTGLVILSPLGFAGMALPPLAKVTGKWWNTLIHQAFFAPILFLLIFVSLKVTEGFSVNANNNSLAAALLQPGASTMGIIMVFLLMSGALIASLIAAKNFGAMGASFAVNTASKVAFGSGNLVTGGAARLTRMGIQRSPMANTGVARFVTANMLRPMEKGALDPRNIKPLSTGLARAGAKDGAKAQNSLASFDKTRKDIFETKPAENKKAYDAEQKKIKDARTESTIVTKAKSGEQLSVDDKNYLVKKSVKDLEQMDAIKDGTKGVVTSLTTEQYEGLMKSEALSGAEKGKIKTARYADVQSAVDSGDSAKIKSVVGGMSKKGLEAIPVEILESDAFLSNLSDKQREDLGGSEKLNRELRDKVKGSSKVELVKQVFEKTKEEKNIDEAIQAVIDGKDGSPTYDSLTREQIAKLPKDILTQPKIIERFTPNVLMALQEEKGKLTPSDITAIANHIKTLGKGNRAYEYVYGEKQMGGAFWS